MADPPKYRAEGARLKAARQALGLTQVELAELIDASLPGIKGYERGMRMPNRAFAAKLADAGINMHYVVSGDGPPTIPPARQRAHREMITRSWPAESPAPPYDVAKNQLELLQATTVTLTNLVNEVSFSPPMQWTALLQELMLLEGLTARGARRILETLKEERQR